MQCPPLKLELTNTLCDLAKTHQLGVAEPVFSTRIILGTWSPSIYKWFLQLYVEPNHYMKNGCFTKHPSKFGCLGYQITIIDKPRIDKPLAMQLELFGPILAQITAPQPPPSISQWRDLDSARQYKKDIEKCKDQQKDTSKTKPTGPIMCMSWWKHVQSKHLQ